MARRRVLFVCTGNIYRSRFAEALFNHHARERGLEWEAVSRGLRPEATPIEDISPYTLAELERLGVSLRHTALRKQRLEEEELEKADEVIALSGEEHRGLFREKFPGWEERVEFWEVADTHLVDPSEALPLIRERVEKMLNFKEG
ncbi:MAG: low molecular weight phosphatase family protein [Verrucomicrobiota bacterium]